MSAKDVLAVAIAAFFLSLAALCAVPFGAGCSGDEVRPVDSDVYDAEGSKGSDVFETAKPKYTKQQFRELFLKALNTKNDQAAEQVNTMFHTMMDGIEKPGFSCQYSMESAQAHLTGARAEFSDVAGPDGDMLKEAWTQLRAELGQPELSALKSWMTTEAQKLIEPQLEMGFSGPEANNFARFVQTCPDQFQAIIDELTNFLKRTNRWLEVFSTETATAPTLSPLGGQTLALCTFLSATT